MVAMVTLENFEAATFDQWQDTLRNIYDIKNEHRHPLDMWLRTVSDSSKVGEAVRKGDAYEAMKYMVHTMSWIITTTNKLLAYSYNGEPALQTYDRRPHTSLTQIVLAKYPTVCPVCQESNCHCPILRKFIEEANPNVRKQTKAEKKEERRKNLITKKSNINSSELPTTLADIAMMLNNIYGQVHYGESVQNITFHFLEEIGEVAWCLTSLDEGMVINRNDDTPLTIQLADEIADVIAWSLAIVGKLASSADQANRLVSVLRPMSPSETAEANVSLMQNHSLLARWLWYTFYNPREMTLCCPSCHHQPCECRKL